MTCVGKSFGEAVFVCINVNKNIAVWVYAIDFTEILDDFLIELVGGVGTTSSDSVEECFLEIVAVAVHKDHGKLSGGSCFGLFNAFLVGTFCILFIFKVRPKRSTQVVELMAFVDVEFNLSLSKLVKITEMVETLKHVSMRRQGRHAGRSVVA